MSKVQCKKHTEPYLGKKEKNTVNMFFFLKSFCPRQFHDEDNSLLSTDDSVKYLAFSGQNWHMDFIQIFSYLQEDENAKHLKETLEKKPMLLKFSEMMYYCEVCYFCVSYSVIIYDCFLC